MAPSLLLLLRLNMTVWCQNREAKVGLNREERRAGSGAPVRGTVTEKHFVTFKERSCSGQRLHPVSFAANEEPGGKTPSLRFNSEGRTPALRVWKQLKANSDQWRGGKHISLFFLSFHLKRIDVSIRLQNFYRPPPPPEHMSSEPTATEVWFPRNVSRTDG